MVSQHAIGEWRGTLLVSGAGRSCESLFRRRPPRPQDPVCPVLLLQKGTPKAKPLVPFVVGVLL
jgi:hypothetical protein